jgi:sugar phosphate isomerase/epimerase
VSAFFCTACIREPGAGEEGVGVSPAPQKSGPLMTAVESRRPTGRLVNRLMKPLKIGIVAESTGLTVRQALVAAARMGARGVQVDAVGDLKPDNLTETGRREFRNLLRSFDLELAALNVPVRRGLDVAENLQPRIERVRKAMQLAFDLGARRVVVACPKLPDDEAAPPATRA